jgi:hypothetical protein
MPSGDQSDHAGLSTAAPERAADRMYLADVLRFLLAFQLGSYVADATLIRHADFPFVLQKLQARYQATQPIAGIAAQYVV